MVLLLLILMVSQVVSPHCLHSHAHTPCASAGARGEECSVSTQEIGGLLTTVDRREGRGGRSM